MEKKVIQFLKLKNLWGSIIPMQVIGIFATYQIYNNLAPNWWLILSMIGYISITLLGISIGYHRYISHKSFQVNSIIKKILLYLGMLGGQGSPIFWAGVHRGYHHKLADTDHDPHTPIKGFWYSYMGWMFVKHSISLKSLPDLLRDNDVLFAHKNYFKILWSTHIILAFIDFQIWLYLLGFPAFIALHTFLFTTSFTHYRKLGYKNFDTKDNSVNCVWLFPFILGEAWHNNHHGNSRNANFGGQRFWELDPSFWIIKIIRQKQ
jgi:stearoyl-CoA desaturase (delta-9 desaturase)